MYKKNSQYNSKIILGIDPGIGITGIGIIEIIKENEITKLKYIYSTSIKTNSLDKIWIRLKYIYDNIKKILDIYNPDIAIIEETFSVPSHGGRSLILAQAKGTVIVCIANTNCNILIEQISVKTIKKNITGSGNATKDEVKIDVIKLLNIQNNISYDESDALAATLSYKNFI
jgi:crossover junction endodeoxyribonuclease RuvC